MLYQIKAHEVDVSNNTFLLLLVGSERWDDKKEGGWRERMDDWKLQQGNLGPEPDDDPDMGL